MPGSLIVPIWMLGNRTQGLVLTWQHKAISPALFCHFCKHVSIIQISEFHRDILIHVCDVCGQIHSLSLSFTVNEAYLLLHCDKRLLQFKGQLCSDSTQVTSQGSSSCWGQSPSLKEGITHGHLSPFLPTFR